MAGHDGIAFFPMDTDVLTDDEKVFDLIESAGGWDDRFTIFGRWVALLCRIYREGPALRLDGRVERKLARDLDMTCAELREFIGMCVDAGLLDRGMYEEMSVLTSRGIQARWLIPKKVKEMPARLRDISLVGRDAPDSPEDSGTSPNSPKRQSEDGVSEDSETCRLDKRREEKRKEEERREEESSSSVTGGMGGVPPCMAAAREDGTWFPDDADGVYPTIGEALEARYRHRTGLTDFPEFVAKVARRCPQGCRGDPQRANHCHALLARALDRFDPSHGSSPIPLAMRIIDQDRGF